jgi:hypothetical protein
MAADRGAKFDSYRDMHSGTQYGSLFFNDGSIRLQDSRSRKRFVVITGAGELNLPSQEGYCFVFNHYDSPNGNGINQKYRLKITKLFTDGRNTEQKLERDYAPTKDVVSSTLPDWCIAGTSNVSKVFAGVQLRRRLFRQGDFVSDQVTDRLFANARVA